MIRKNSSSENDNPLVSVIVITYNSAEFVLETLESAKAQTYQNIELIISDDGSQDMTVDICQNWLEQNKDRFVHSELLAVEKNTGIPANCNRGVKAAKGEWIKLIAGDDLLIEDCIENNLKFVIMGSPKKFVVLSDMLVFTGNKIVRESLVKDLKDTSEQQYQSLLSQSLSNVPSLFVSRTVYDSFSYDETQPFEDYPFFLTVTKMGYKIFHLDKFTVKYRIGHDSAFGSANDLLFTNFYKKMESFNEKYRFPYLPANTVRRIKVDNFIMDYFNRYGLNKKTIFSKILLRLARALNIYRYLS